jgi:hypothetical protein
MQEHPMRERIYLPVVRFGVPHTDWKYVFIITLCGFVLPFVLNIKLYGVPAPMFLGVAALALSVAFFNFIRIGRRPLWFQHSARALLVSSRERAALPVDDLNEVWLEVADDGDQGMPRRSERKTRLAQVFRFEHL